jgi:hypothetical protein
MEKPDFQSRNLFSTMLEQERTSEPVPGRKSVMNAAKDTFSFTTEPEEHLPGSSRGRRRNEQNGRSQISFSPNDIGDGEGGVRISKRGAGRSAPQSRRPDSIIPDHGNSHIGVSVIPDHGDGYAIGNPRAQNFMLRNKPVTKVAENPINRMHSDVFSENSEHANNDYERTARVRSNMPVGGQSSMNHYLNDDEPVIDARNVVQPHIESNFTFDQQGHDLSSDHLIGPDGKRILTRKAVPDFAPIPRATPVTDDGYTRNGYPKSMGLSSGSQSNSDIAKRISPLSSPRKKSAGQTSTSSFLTGGDPLPGGAPVSSRRNMGMYQDRNRDTSIW